MSVLAALFLALASGHGETKQADERPNIVFLLADDLGYGELGSYGQEDIKTPFLDKLAAEGMRFTDFYAGSSVCSPSRAVLFTGRHTGHVSIRGNKGIYSDGVWDRVPLRKDEVTLAEMLRDGGYQTGFVGKFHVEDPNDLSTWAINRGFDYAIQEQWSSARGGEKFPYGMQWIGQREEGVMYNHEDWDCLDHFRTEYALEYLNTVDAEKPFFLFMSYRSPHAHEFKIRDNDLYKDRGWPEIERTHAARITMLDAQIERLFQRLEEMGELENTVVFLTSDNGGHAEGPPEVKHDHRFFMSNGPLKGYKRDLYEGGMRVPFIAYWPGKIKAGSVSDHIGASYDFMPTLAEIAGVECPEQTDGISIVPELTGNPQPEHEYLYWEFHSPHVAGKQGRKGFRQAIRRGHWKAVRYGVAEKTELYDLRRDIGEENDLAANHPELVQEFEKQFRLTSQETPRFPFGGLSEK
ncbi:arylsulfatase [Pelagicoccus mobilis]